MALTITGLALAVLTGWLVWRAADRFWHLAVIAVLAVPLMPLLATTITGDVSSHLPGWMFADDASGKGDVIVASVAATVLLAVVLAACVFAVAKTIRRAASSRRAS